MNATVVADRSRVDHKAAVLDSIVEAIREYQGLHGFAPTRRELAELVGLRSISTIHDHLLDLQRQGRISIKGGASRALTLNSGFTSPDALRVAPSSADEMVACEVFYAEIWGVGEHLHPVEIKTDGGSDRLPAQLLVEFEAAADRFDSVGHKVMDFLKSQAEPVPTCRRCGCTDEDGCVAGCYWVEPDLCSECSPRGET